MFRILATVLAAAALSSPEALAHQAQFRLNIRITGCHVTPQRSSCEEGVVAVDEIISEDFRAIGDPVRDPGFEQAHHLKSYTLRWPEFGEQKELTVAVRITRGPLPSRDLSFSFTIFPREGKDGDQRETSLSVARLEDIKRLWLASKSDVKPAAPGEGAKGDWEVWASVVISELKELP